MEFVKHLIHLGQKYQTMERTLDICLIFGLFQGTEYKCSSCYLFTQVKIDGIHQL